LQDSITRDNSRNEVDSDISSKMGSSFSWWVEILDYNFLLLCGRGSCLTMNGYLLFTVYMQHCLWFIFVYWIVRVFIFCNFFCQTTIFYFWKPVILQFLTWGTTFLISISVKETFYNCDKVSELTWNLESPILKHKIKPKLWMSHTIFASYRYKNNSNFKVYKLAYYPWK
jgi:hypothetical protein